MTNGKIGTGFIGTPAILPALVKIGAADLAEKLFLQPDVPGWLYQVERGATTIWERWDAIRRRRHDLRSRHELLQPLCLRRGLPVAVRGRRGLPARSRRSRASSASSSSRRSCRGSASRGRATTRPPAGSRRAGRSTDGAVDYTVRVPEGAEGLLVLGDDHAEATVDGAALGRDADGKPAGPSGRASIASASDWHRHLRAPR